MAKTIALVECPAPTNPTATAIAGGSLTAGKTYYYRIIAIGPGDSYYGGDSAMFWTSIPCVEVFATTDATNKSIELYWDNPVDSNGMDGEVFMIFRTEVSGDYDAYKAGSYYSHLLAAGASVRVYGITKSSCTAVGAGYKYTDDGSRGLISCPLIEEGVPCFEIEGGTSADPITPENLYDWAVTNGKTYCIDKWDFAPMVERAVAIKAVASIRQPQPGSVDLHFRIDDSTYFLQIWGKIYFDSDSYFYMGRLSGSWLRRGAVWQRNGVYAWYCGSTGNMEIYDSVLMATPNQYFQTEVNGGNMFHFYQSADKSVKIYNSIYNPKGYSGSSGRVSSDAIDIRRTTMHTPAIELMAPEMNLDDNLIVSYIKGHYYMREGTAKNCEIIPSYSYQYLSSTDSNTEDSMYHFINVEFNEDPPDFRGYCRQFTAWHCALEKHTLDIKVVDKEGNAISGVTVTIADKNGYGAMWMDKTKLSEDISIGETDWTIADASGMSIGDFIKVNMEVVEITNIVGNVLTVVRAKEGTVDRQYNTAQKVFLRSVSLDSNASGEIDEITLAKRTYWVDPAATYPPIATVVMNRTDNFPFTIEISKAGYKTYKTKFTLDSKTDWTICLQKVLNLNFSKRVSIHNY